MNRKILLFALTALLLAVFTCCNHNDDDDLNANNDEDLVPGQLAILTLGDSRVQGARPAFESYRYELWKNLVSANYNFNLIGPFEEAADGYPLFQGLAFDGDHGGVGGNTTVSLLNRLDEALLSAERAPDLVLLGIGGNDLLRIEEQGNTEAESRALANIDVMIDQIQAANPNVTIILEQIAGANPSEPEAASLNTVVNSFNASLAQMAQAQTSGNSKVLVVNMQTNFGAQYYADDVHYNEAGAKEIADRYFTVIEGL